MEVWEWGLGCLLLDAISGVFFDAVVCRCGSLSTRWFVVAVVCQRGGLSTR